MAGAIEEGVVTPDTRLDRRRHSITVGDKPFDDVEEHATEELTTARHPRESSNVGTIKIARELGKDRFADYLRAFGFGQRTGLDFPGEEPGVTLRRSRSTTTPAWASMPIGYGIAVTAMQMLDVYTTIANDGIARPPRLVAATIGADGSPPRRAARRAPAGGVGGRPRRPSTGCSQKVVNEGTGVKAQIPGYTVAGKTGTARKAPYDTGRVRTRRSSGSRPRATPAGGDRGDRRPAGQPATAPTPPRRCSRRSCSTRSPTSGCRRRDAGPPRGRPPVPGTLTPIP